MGSSIKVTLRKKANKQGLFPLAVRITKNRKTTYLYIGHYISIKYWDEGNREVRKSHPNSSRLNNLLVKKLAEANQTLIDLQTHQNDITSKQIKQEIATPLTKTSFKEIADNYLDNLEKTNKLQRLSSDKARVGHFVRFVDNDDLSFREIDEALLRRFSLYLKTTRKVSQRSVINNLIVIRTLYNKAIRLGIVDRKLYPFGADKIRIKFPESEKIGLTREEIQAIEALEELTEQQSHARNVWLFSFYLAGMRVGDVLMIKWSDIYDGRLHYRMGKNEKLLSFKLPEKIIALLGRYEKDPRSSEDFVFPEMNNADLKNPKDVFNKVKSANKKFNKYLVQIAEKAGINKKLTMHIARHSFGNISGDKIPIQMLQKLYRHSTVTTTINYQANFMHRETDDALEKVINF
ncbi:site-specific integrase [Arenibacter algicola]|uniref:Site-specific tyrosine recombinase XerD n=1 Tax=Arenibacter algicola TaxID=616991 RepID=A0A221UVW0_9FLAO|nr:site-specific integrase [Arenibacter algicola]ASO05318.1 site-specific tyrosine recombinase XerD [Arenibacter algicola]|tara:strand:+ start:33870 stop:35084 length:1215 start_codon:yes stop_codon:yes gene_type:complete